MAAAEWFPGQVSMGMAIHVVGVPGEPLDPDIAKPTTAATASTTTTSPTTVPPVTTTTAPNLLGNLLKPQP
jgi:hypothetical protein